MPLSNSELADIIIIYSTELSNQFEASESNTEKMMINYKLEAIATLQTRILDAVKGKDSVSRDFLDKYDKWLKEAN